jgi:large subunit ribosomal protein L5
MATKQQKSKARLEQQYLDVIRPALKEKLVLKNDLQVPKLAKIVLNVGVKDAISDSKILPKVIQVLTVIAGQRAVRTLARKSIAGFKLREGMPIGAKVTLRKAAMYEFLDRLISLALPKVRDFQGVPLKLDGQGNYNLGIKEWTIFPEVEYELTDRMHGLNITIHTTAMSDEHARELLKDFGMPFRKA